MILMRKEPTRPDLPVDPKFDCYDFRYRLPAPNLGIYDLIPPLTITYISSSLH